MFSPITGAFTIVENIPGAKQVADVISLPFRAIGSATSLTIGEIIDNIPDSILSKKTKEIIKQPLQEAGATVTEIALGGKTMDIISKKITKGEKITPEVAQKAVEQAKKELKANPPKETTTPKEIGRAHV